MSGTPKREIYCVVRVVATVCADMLSMGHASGQRVKRSTHVSKYLHPLEGGSGPTKSICICPKRRSGGANGVKGETVYLNTFVRCHCMQHLSQYLICLFIPGQQYLFPIRRKVALPPPWAWPCRPSKTVRRCRSGTYIRACFVDVSK